MELTIEAEGLCKRFGDTQALDGVDLAARQGSVLGVLGPNGAGKTTAVRILATLHQRRRRQRPRRRPRRRPRAGEGPRDDRPDRPVRVGRRAADRRAEPRHDRPAAGPQRATGQGPRAGAARLVRPHRGRRAAPPRPTRGGMRRRLDLAASLVGRPSVIFLDEPTTGLDPAKREDMWGVVRSLVDDGSTVLLTTQYLDEADALADEITVIDHGRVIAHDTPDGLKRVVGGQTPHRAPGRPDAPGRRRARSSATSPAPGRSRRPRRRQRPGHAATRCSATPSAGSATPASPSPSSPCTCPASTRSSSPSPAAPPPS